MKRIHTHIQQADRSNRASLLYLTAQALLSPIAVLLGWLMGLPGIQFHLRSVNVGFRLVRLRAKSVKNKWSRIYSLIFGPIDSIRYFELGYLWEEVSELDDLEYYLDIASPRLFPLELASRRTGLTAILTNPDVTDIEFTQICVEAMDLDHRIVCKASRIEELDPRLASFNLITSISVLEHIPDERKALENIWRLLKPGGTLLISLPCASKAFEEFVDVDEYQLYPITDDGFVFGQRFYNDALLKERVFSLIGEPVNYQIFGEKKNGFYFKDRQDKNQLGSRYPFWSEPIRTKKNWVAFDRISSLPGVGVIILRFQKELASVEL